MWRQAAAQPMQIRQIVRSAAPSRVANIEPTVTPSADSKEAPSKGEAKASDQSVARAPAPTAPGLAANVPPMAAERAPDAPTPPAPGALARAQAITSERDARPRDEDEEPGPSAASSPLPGGTEVPVYATQFPAAQTLSYRLRRGPAQGSAELQWLPQGDRYVLQLNNLLNGQPVLGSRSQGRIDAHGLAPERHSESRRGRDVRAANFQRDTARITFSGPRAEYPLLAGVQDRLSWMLQLPAVLTANPALAAAGRELTLYVVGARGDATLWTFRIEGPATLTLPDGSSLPALHLHREPSRLYDTQVDVWLDPARQHLPVRVLLRNRADGPGTELLLTSTTSP